MEKAHKIPKSLKTIIFLLILPLQSLKTAFPNYKITEKLNVFQIIHRIHQIFYHIQALMICSLKKFYQLHFH